MIALKLERPSNNRLLQYLAFLALLSCFILQVWESMGKFLSGKTTTAIHTKGESGGGMLMPNVILCPGFRPELSDNFVRRDVHPWPINTYYDSYPEHRGEKISQAIVEQWWNNITYNLNDFVKSIKLKSVSKRVTVDIRNSSGYLTNDNIVIEEVSSALGKCYIFKPYDKFEFPSQYMKIELDLSILPQKSIVVYVTNAGGELGLQSNYWMTDVIFDQVQSRQFGYDLALKKEETVMRSNDQNLCKDYPMQEWFACALAWEKKQLLNPNCPKACAFPQSDLVTRSMFPKLDSCATEEEWNCSRDVYIDTFRDHVNPTLTGCPKSCRFTRFAADKRVDVTKNMGNKTFIYVYYHTTRVMVYEEYLLFDFGSIVSAVGGSLGLFLGFSCWQMIKAAIALRHQSLPTLFINGK